MNNGKYNKLEANKPMVNGFDIQHLFTIKLRLNDIFRKIKRRNNRKKRKR